jgi:uncharacterized protein (TIGR03083 family)
MDTDALLAALDTESSRFAEALRGTPLDAPVPSCPGWTAADLWWHLGEVQHTWALVVESGTDDPEDLEEPERPSDEALERFFLDATQSLSAALRSKPAGARCWTWHPEGDTVGWLIRRQAHEALVHRVDAELTAGREPAAPDDALVLDGIDELLTVYVEGLPAWADLTPLEVEVAVACDDAAGTWTLELLQWSGTSPNTGSTYTDEGAARVVEPSGPPAATVRGSAWALHRWLWGRGDATELRIDGDRTAADRLRSIIAESTQ